MPPRLPNGCAMRTPLTQLGFLRLFSSSFAVAAPPPPTPREPHHQNQRSQPSSSSNSSLLSVGSRDRAPRNAPASYGQEKSGSNRGDAASRMLNRYRDRAETTIRNKQAQVEFLRSRQISNDYLKQMPRRWEAGDVYSPHDMSPVEMQKWRRRSPRGSDVVDVLGLRPLDMYKNFSLVKEFTTTSGQIVNSSLSTLRPVNQRKIAKMIRRVQGMGIYPTIHAHPEMLRDDFFPRGDR